MSKPGEFRPISKPLTSKPEDSSKKKIAQMASLVLKTTDPKSVKAKPLEKDPNTGRRTLRLKL